ncbi:hypothetical protein [Acinetobacter sp. ANC 5414]|uniref:hypothetical protein n=1 Tax=Acinetobacter sp. ANC 5414 TaxID=2731251 RepID=UPI00148FF333|nr:hypothetical protein [Acinetobacter sp. ANC 5414]NNH01933.1 hypothetical protein [Acinetobacter sp. ANC 5414]
MTSRHYLEFHPADNPMYLKKVGHWVVTFLSTTDELANIQLAITSVLPRQVSENLQPVRVIIHKTDIENRWLIQQIECYDSAQGKDEQFSCNDEIGIKVIHSIIQEFDKYDVEINLL